MPKVKLEEPNSELDLQKVLDELDEPDEIDDDTPDPIIEKSEDAQHIKVKPQTITKAPKPDKADGGDDSGAGNGDLIDKITSKFSEVLDGIWGMVASDRKLVDKYIALLTDRISEPDTTKSCYIVALTALINTKASTSMNSTRV